MGKTLTPKQFHAAIYIIEKERNIAHAEKYWIYYLVGTVVCFLIAAQGKGSMADSLFMWASVILFFATGGTLQEKFKSSRAKKEIAELGDLKVAINEHRIESCFYHQFQRLNPSAEMTNEVRDWILRDQKLFLYNIPGKYEGVL